jgi:hypothetical protein
MIVMPPLWPRYQPFRSNFGSSAASIIGASILPVWPTGRILIARYRHLGSTQEVTWTSMFNCSVQTIQTSVARKARFGKTEVALANPVIVFAADEESGPVRKEYFARTILWYLSRTIWPRDRDLPAS